MIQNIAHHDSHQTTLQQLESIALQPRERIIQFTVWFVQLLRRVDANMSEDVFSMSPFSNPIMLHDSPDDRSHHQPHEQLASGEEYEVDQILDSRWHPPNLQYLFLWKGYPMSDATWERSANMQNAMELVQDFHHRYPHKPKTNLGRRRRRGDNVKI